LINLKVFGKTHIKTLILALSAILSLSHCANAPQSAKTKIDKTQTQTQKKSFQNDSANYFINLAEQAQTQERSSTAIRDLVLACEKLFQQQAFKKALWLANQLSPLTTTHIDQYRLALIKAQALLALNRYQLAYVQINQASEHASLGKIPLSAVYYLSLSLIQQQRGLNAEALIATLHYFSLNKQTNNDDITKIWQNFSELTQWQLKIISQAKPPYSKGWLALIHYANKYGDKTNQFDRFLTNWQRQYPNHPANSVIPLIQQNLKLRNIDSIANIAVLLPLSGKQKAAGVAAQQGILAAYKSNSTSQLHFIDTNNIDWSSLGLTFTEQNIDYVIGPLLKSNVDNYLALSELSTDTLLLNISGKNSLRDNQTAISMRPEDEAIQAADTLSRRHYKHPLIISDEDKVSQRITQNFIQQWQKNTTQAPEVFYLTNDNKTAKSSKKRQQNIQTSLEVEQSKARVKALKLRLKQTIKTETRNRRDVDMIYLVSNSQKTRLLKPYVDVSISPFADLIPVFSSSRSHSAKADRQGTRDLSGLTFTEIPWLLKSKQQNTALAAINEQLWPQRSDSLQTIFALGFDSLALIYKLPLMRQVAYIRHFGQTGTLKYNPNKIITRSLIWGKYHNNKVQAIAME